MNGINRRGVLAIHRAHRAVALALAVSLSVPAMAGCSRTKPETQATAQQKVSLYVENRGFLDVAVFAVRTPGGSGVRVGNVRGLTEATLKIDESALQPGGRLVVFLRSIGSRYTWTSPAVSVSGSWTARLDVRSDGSGNLSQSTLYTEYTSSR